MTLTGFDFIIIFIILASSIFSMFKGFVSEFTSGISLLISGLLSYSVGKDLSPYILTVIPIQAIAYILSYGIVFLLSLLGTFVLINMLLSSLKINPKLNHILGLGFGLIKSIVIASLVLMMIDFCIPYQHQPKAMQDSYLKKTILKKFIL